MNINENTDLIGFIVWLICSCNLGKKNYKFFSFLKKYVEKFGETNEEIKMRGQS